MHFGSELLDPRGQFMRHLRQARILSQQCAKFRGLFGSESLTFEAGFGEVLSMSRIRFGMRLVTVSLTGLGEEDERRGVGSLETKGKVEKDEGIFVETPSRGDGHDVHDNPDRNDDRLPDQKNRGPKEAGESLGF